MGPFGLTQTFHSSGRSIELYGGGYINTNGHNLTILGGISDNGILIKTGTGNLTISGTKTGTGEIQVSGGTLVLNSDLTTGSSGNLSIIGSNVTATLTQTSNTTTFNSSTVYIGANSSDVGTYNLQNGAILNIGTSGSSNTLYVGYSGIGTFNQSGTSNNTVNGSLYISNSASSYNISGGTLVAGALYNYGTFTESGGGVGTFGLANEYTFSQSNGSVNLIYGTFLNDTGATYTLSGTATVFGTDNTYGGANAINNGDFTQTGGTASLINLSGNGTFSLSGGVLSLSGSNNSLNSLTFTFNGGTLQTNANISTSASFTTIAAGGATLSPAASSSLTLTGAISGNGTLNAMGAGTLTLSHNNTYSGGTTLSNGTLAVINTSGSATGTGNVTLNGGTLAGNGTISGTVLAGSGAHTINPGGSGTVATLTIGGLSTNANTTLAFDLATPTGTSDRLAVNGNVSLSNGTLAITTNTTGASSLGYYQVLSYSGTLTGSTGGITLPTVTNNVKYTLDSTQNTGYIDVHRGYIGDANDDGTVNSTDLSTVLHDLGMTTNSWLLGNFEGAATVDLDDLDDVLNNLGNSIGTYAIVGGGTGNGTLAAEVRHLRRMTAGFDNMLTPAEIAEIQDYAKSVGLETSGGSGSGALAAAVRPVPEPGSLALLGIGGGLLLRRRGGGGGERGNKSSRRQL